MPDVLEQFHVLLSIILFLLTFICAAVWLGKRYWKKRTTDAELKKKYIIQSNFGLYGTIISLILLVVLYVYVGSYKIRDRFFWKYDKNTSVEEIFVVYARKKTDENRSQNADALHMDWLHRDVQEEAAATVVTRTMVNAYEENVAAVYSVVPVKENVLHEKEAEEGFAVQLQQFEAVIRNGGYDSMSSEELWEDFLAGEEVCKVNHTSENVYQRAMLAEAAHYNASLSGISADITSVYIAGAMEAFEEALQFKNRDSGNGMQYTDKDIARQTGIMLVRESWQYRGESTQEDREKHLHCAVFGYACFGYVLSNEQLTDKNYMMDLY